MEYGRYVRFGLGAAGWEPDALPAADALATWPFASVDVGGCGAYIKRVLRITSAGVPWPRAVWTADCKVDNETVGLSGVAAAAG